MRQQSQLFWPSQTHAVISISNPHRSRLAFIQIDHPRKLLSCQRSLPNYGQSCSSFYDSTPAALTQGLGQPKVPSVLRDNNTVGRWRRLTTIDAPIFDDAPIFGKRTVRCTLRAPNVSVTSNNQHGASQGIVDNVSWRFVGVGPAHCH